MYIKVSWSDVLITMSLSCALDMNSVDSSLIVNEDENNSLVKIVFRIVESVFESTPTAFGFGPLIFLENSFQA